MYYLQRPFPHSMYKTFYFCRRKWNWYVHTPNAQVPVLHTSIYRGIEYTQLLKASGLCKISEKIYYQSRQHTMYLPHILIRLFFNTSSMFIKCPYNVENLRTNYIIITAWRILSKSMPLSPRVEQRPSVPQNTSQSLIT